MTTTATAKRTPSAELAKLQDQRDESYADLQVIKRERSGYDNETTQMRAEFSAFTASRPEDWRDAAHNPKPGTPSAEREAEVKARMEAVNPHEEAFYAARQLFHDADEALNRFLVERLFDLIDEDESAFNAAQAKIRQGFALLIEGGADYNAIVERARSLILAVPHLNGQALTHDPRPLEWEATARASLDSDLRRPGLTEDGAWRLTNV